MIDPFANDDRFNRLLSKLSLPKAFVVGLIQMIVMRCKVNNTDLLGDNENDVERMADWPGRPGEFWRYFKTEYVIELGGKFYFRGLGSWACIEVQQMPVRKGRDFIEEANEILGETGIYVSEHGLERLGEITRQYGPRLAREAIMVAISEVGSGPKVIEHAVAWIGEYERKRSERAERMRIIATRKTSPKAGQGEA